MRRRWHILTDWIKENAYEYVLEIGAGRGITANKVLRSVDKYLLWAAIDPLTFYDDSKERIYEKLSDLIANGRYKLIEDYCQDTADLFPDDFFDIVFIDGDHRYDQVLSDIIAYYNKAKYIVCGHDYGHKDYSGVKKAVDEFCDYYNKTLYLEDDYMWYIKR